MRFGIITHAIHKIKDGQIYAYEPYVREMNLWTKFVDEVIIICPVSLEKNNNIEIAYHHKNIKVVTIPNFDITSVKNLLIALWVLPKICWQIINVMKQVDHIHLRCPGNIGLLGCLMQVFFPSKTKTAKYAGNWDPKSNQPLTYKFQKWILGNTLLAKNLKVLVYGNWPHQSKNILPFFTASYHESEIVEIPSKNFNGHINLIFVGGFTEGKQPLISVMAAHELLKKAYPVRLHMYGDGVMKPKVEAYVKQYNLEDYVILHGNVPKTVVKSAFQKSHFLIFISKSEGWPKVVAEAMFWECLPISSKVSCVLDMLGNNTRGKVVNSSVDEIVFVVENYLNNFDFYQEHVYNAKEWSRTYTLEKFEREIKNMIYG